jgi:hypothetical protein
MLPQKFHPIQFPVPYILPKNGLASGLISAQLSGCHFDEIVPFF